MSVVVGRSPGITRRRLHVYVAARYSHRPYGGSEPYGDSQASLCLTRAVQRLFDATPHGPSMALARRRPKPRRIEAHVDTHLTATRPPET